MIAEKYDIREHQFEKMSRKDRNKFLVKMLETQNNMIVFP